MFIAYINKLWPLGQNIMQLIYVSKVLLKQRHIYLSTFYSIFHESFPGGALVENSSASVGDTGDMGLIPGSGRSPGGGNGTLLQYPCLGNPKDGEPGRLQSIGSQRMGHY